eukprot:4370589-Amphidinium_carterae.1
MMQHACACARAVWSLRNAKERLRHNSYATQCARVTFQTLRTVMLMQTCAVNLARLRDQGKNESERVRGHFAGPYRQ